MWTLSSIVVIHTSSGLVWHITYLSALLPRISCWARATRSGSTKFVDHSAFMAGALISAGEPTTTIRAQMAIAIAIAPATFRNRPFTGLRWGATAPKACTDPITCQSPLSTGKRSKCCWEHALRSFTLASNTKLPAALAKPLLSAPGTACKELVLCSFIHDAGCCFWRRRSQAESDWATERFRAYKPIFWHGKIVHARRALAWLECMPVCGTQRVARRATRRSHKKLPGMELRAA